MKYEPRHSNFVEMQDEIVEELLGIYSKIENVKDTVAKVIDGYVDAIMEETINGQFLCGVVEPGKGAFVTYYPGGEGMKVDGDVFTTQQSLESLIQNLVEHEFDYREDAEATAAMLEREAARIREIAKGCMFESIGDD